MKIAVISFTDQGSRQNQRLLQLLKGLGMEAEGYSMAKYAGASQGNALIPVNESIDQWAGRLFPVADGLIFIGAAGIAVRSIAGHLEGKEKDPAVLVIDEKGQYVIPILSGHIGGGNRLALILAREMKAQPVITTATDVNGCFAVDSFAAEHEMVVSNPGMIKYISAALLDGRKVGMVSDYPVKGRLPAGVISDQHMPESIVKTLNEGDTGTIAGSLSGITDEIMEGFCISLSQTKRPFKRTLNLIPAIVTVGIGCRKNTPSELIEKMVLGVLAAAGIDMAAIERVCSIDLKKEEQGIIDFCHQYKKDFITYSAAQLNTAEGITQESVFVRKTTGCGNVCEASAILGSRMGKLIVKKTAADGITVAAATREWSVDFE